MVTDMDTGKNFKSRKHLCISKGTSLKEISQIIFKHIRRRIKLITFILLLLGILYCINLYYISNTIPTRRIEINLREKGDADSAICYIYINLNYSQATLKDSTLIHNNINIKASCQENATPLFPPENRDVHFMMMEKGSYRHLSHLLNDSLNNIYLMYILDYKLYSNIGGIKRTKEFLKKNEDGSISYMSAPVWNNDTQDYPYIKGKGFILFPATKNGIGNYSFNTNIDNQSQKIWYPWDISQSNIKFSLNTSNINCKKIQFNFYTPTNFTAMYPEPDKISCTSIEFTNQQKILSIIKDGLFFHVSFPNNKTLLDLRNLIINSLTSIIIAFICNIIWNLLSQIKADKD